MYTLVAKLASALLFLALSACDESPSAPNKPTRPIASAPASAPLASAPSPAPIDPDCPLLYFYHPNPAARAEPYCARILARCVDSDGVPRDQCE